MKEYLIISGKGGTGKTSLTASFAVLASRTATPLLCDADVDAADLHLLLAPEVEEKHDFMGGSLAVIRQDDCTECATCRNLCRFDAISQDFVVDPIACEGCGVCVDLCPEQAITFPRQKSGEYYFSTSRTGPMVHARLGIAEENSGKLVSIIRREAREIAKEKNCDLIITDGPPGIGCPVIASLTGTQRAILVVEPTLSGMHDIERVVQLTNHFRVETMLCVNRYDLNEEITEKIEDLARLNGVAILPRIPFDPDFVRAMIEKKTIVEYNEQSPSACKVKEVWAQIVSYQPDHSKAFLTLKNHM